MGKKNKSKKVKGSEKTLKKTQRKIEKKFIKIEKESGEQPIETLLEEFRFKQCKLTEVISTPSAPPSPRSHFTLTAVPDSNELILFGGEYYNGSRTVMYADLFVFNCRERQWSLVRSPNTPPPRSGHQAVFMKTLTVPASIWIFGGEYASPTMARFHHYKDLWNLRVRTRKWEHVQIVGSAGPCARSGHRMIAWKNSLLLFGGFTDTGGQTVYYNDLWSFDLVSCSWNMIRLEGDLLTTRSGCLLLPGSDMKTIYLLGGYRKDRISRDVERGVALSDYFRICFDKGSATAKCVSLRTSGVRPTPRSGLSGVLHLANSALVFGGVHDTESEDGVSVLGHFHNDMYTFELDKARWHLFNYSTTKTRDHTSMASHVQDSQSSGSPVVSPPRCAQQSTPNGLSSMALQDVQPPCSTSHFCDISRLKSGSGDTEIGLPSPRSNAGMAVLASSLYLYGGMFEVGDRKVTLDDFYCLDLNKPYSWQCLFPGTHTEQEWHGSDMDEDDDSDAEEPSSNSSSESMEVDDSSDSDDDDEIVEDAPLPISLETHTAYWNRTTEFWCSLVTKGLQDTSDHPGPSSGTDPAVIVLAKRLAEDFYQKHSGS